MATVSASWSAAHGSSESNSQKLAENILIVAGESTGNLMTVVQMRCAGRTAACRAVAGTADGLETGASGAAAALMTDGSEPCGATISCKPARLEVEGLAPACVPRTIAVKAKAVMNSVNARVRRVLTSLRDTGKGAGIVLHEPTSRSRLLQTDRNQACALVGHL